jgi:Uma2 family endonuclease
VGQRSGDESDYDRRMSAEAIARYMPAVLTLDDLAVMNETDTYGHRYEMSPEGALSVMPPPEFAHAQIINDVIEWLLAAGWTLKQIHQAVGLQISGRVGGTGGRIPDLIVWSRPPVPRAGWMPVTDVALVVEVISPSSKNTDTKVKRDEYSGTGIPRYWTIDCDPAQTVTIYELDGDTYPVCETMPLSRLLTTDPSDHLG